MLTKEPLNLSLLKFKKIMVRDNPWQLKSTSYSKTLLN